jgi:hypothetical protein
LKGRSACGAPRHRPAACARGTRATAAARRTSQAASRKRHRTAPRAQATAPSCTVPQTRRLRRATRATAALQRTHALASREQPTGPRSRAACHMGSPAPIPSARPGSSQGGWLDWAVTVSAAEPPEGSAPGPAAGPARLERICGETARANPERCVHNDSDGGGLSMLPLRSGSASGRAPRSALTLRICSALSAAARPGRRSSSVVSGKLSRRTCGTAASR